jgi:hypothetical protein
MKEFRWNDRTEKAAVLLAQDELTHDAIAEQVGVTRPTLWHWRNHPEFAARVQSHIDQFREVTLSRGIADRARRVAALHDRWRRMHRVIAERAESDRMADVPGGTTGLLAHTVKGVGRGEDFQLIDLYEVDTGLLKELREHEKQAAQELGQWTEKYDHTSGGKPFQPITTIEVHEPPDPDPGPGPDPAPESP